MRLKFFNKRLRNNYLKFASALLTIESFILIFVELSNESRMPVLIVSLFVYAILYVVMYFLARNIKKRNINLGNTKITVKYGDLFKEKGLKVIACNEYFDSQVDEVLISSKTLHGKVMTEYITDIKDFDQKLLDDDYCNKRIIDVNANRLVGKQNKYQLGTCFPYDDFIFVAFSAFNDDNEAYLDLLNYMLCLSNMWYELNRVYGGNNIVLPLVGSGITRINASGHITKQEQLNFLITTLRFCDITFSHDSNITIVLPENLKDELSLYEL